MFIQALSDELARQLSSVPRALPYPAGVIDEGERAIADGRVEVASALPGPVTLTFDKDQASVPHGFEAVMFANAIVAAEFLSDILRTADNMTALQAALADPAGQRYEGTASAGRPAGAGAMSVGATSLVQRTALLLAIRVLVLLPVDLSRRRLRVAWLEHRVPSVAATDSAGSPAPMRAASSPPPQPAGPMSVLPDPPTELSPQAQTLIEAAKNGTPFCEECARAAELAGV